MGKHIAVTRDLPDSLRVGRTLADSFDAGSNARQAADSRLGDLSGP
jgi:hypothetical protein